MRVAFLFVGFVVALGLAEVALRIFGHEGPVYTIRDPVIGRRYTRSWEGDCYIEESDRVVHLRFNREGMRDRDWPEERTPDTVRIAVLGDSMVAALGVPEEKTFVRLLQARLQSDENETAARLARTRRTYEVMNWGVQGSSPALQSVLYEQRVRRYLPDLVLRVFFTGNDFSDDWQPIGGRRQGWEAVREDGSLAHEPFGGSPCSFNEWLARNCRLYVWQKRLLARLRDDGEGPLRAGLRIFDRSGDPELAKAWEFQRQLDRRMRLLVAQTRYRPPVEYESIVLPAAEEVYDDLWNDAAEKARALGWDLQRTLDEELVTSSSRVRSSGTENPWPAEPLGWDGLWDVFRKHAAGRPSTVPEAGLYLGRTGHLNELGHELVAAALAPRLFGRTAQ